MKVNDYEDANATHSDSILSGNSSQKLIKKVSNQFVNSKMGIILFRSMSLGHIYILFTERKEWERITLTFKLRIEICMLYTGVTNITLISST